VPHRLSKVRRTNVLQHFVQRRAPQGKAGCANQFGADRSRAFMESRLSIKCNPETSAVFQLKRPGVTCASGLRCPVVTAVPRWAKQGVPAPHPNVLHKKNVLPSRRFVEALQVLGSPQTVTRKDRSEPEQRLPAASPNNRVLRARGVATW
jgi:hypothetical protein